jgi:hypothetical protein
LGWVGGYQGQSGGDIDEEGETVAERVEVQVAPTTHYGSYTEKRRKRGKEKRNEKKKERKNEKLGSREGKITAVYRGGEGE